MRYAIVSDIHANLPAWKTVLADISLRNADRIICLGDTVGYGPEPAETLKSVYEHVHLMILGNHDAVVGKRMDASGFTDQAQRMINWTSEKLGAKARALFATLPLVITGKNFRCSHGGFKDPAVFDYVETQEEALESFNATKEQVLFCGHSHNPGLFVLGNSGVAHWLEPQDFELEEGKRYIVNVGSVGSPRDGNPRASYVMFDDEAATVQFFRATFDFAAFGAAVAKAGLKMDDVPMLRSRPAKGADAVRVAPDFSPDASQRVTGDVVENDVTMLIKKSTAKWRRLACAAIGLGVVAAGAAAILYLTRPEPGKIPAAFPEFRPSPIPATKIQADGTSLPPLSATDFGAFEARPYRVVLEDSAKQKVAAEAIQGGSGSCVVFTSESASSEIRLESPDINCYAGDRLEVVSKAYFAPDFSGALAVSVWLVKETPEGDRIQETLLKTMNFNDQTGLKDGSLPTALRNLPNSAGWRIARGTTDGIPGGGYARVVVAGKFKGTVKIGGVSAKRR